MMAPLTSDAIHEDLSKRLPSWVMRRTTGAPPLRGPLTLGDETLGEFVLGEAAPIEERAKDAVFGALCDEFADWHKWFAALMRGTEIETADGEWLEAHAAERGLARQAGEDDETLRARIRMIPDAATEEAIRASVAAVAGPNVRCFTLRYHLLAFGRPELPAPPVRLTRTAWRRGALWAGGSIARNMAERRPLVWRSGYWGRGYWGGFGLPIRREGTSPWNVAVVVVPRRMARVRTAWRRFHWRHSHWGGARADLAHYRAVRSAAERPRAAGITLLIWIDPRLPEET